MTGRSASVRRRWVSLGVLAVAAALVPAAIAWACNPQAHISLSNTTLSPGQSFDVYGSYFKGNSVIQVSGAGNSASPTSSAGGAFTVTGFKAPTAPGTYTITALRPTGGYAPVSFQVVAPAASDPAPSSSGGETSQQPSTPAQQQSDSGSSFATPGVAKSERQSASRERGSGNDNRSGGSGNGSGGSGTQGTASPQTTAPAAPAQPVFSGSTTAASTAPTFSSQPSTTGATSRGTRGNSSERSTSGGRSTAPSTAAEPSQQTAFSDVWSGYQPGRTASLSAASAGTPDDGPGSAFAWGIGLLAVGLFALVGGLAYTEARRRRLA